MFQTCFFLHPLSWELNKGSNYAQKLQSKVNNGYKLLKIFHCFQILQIFIPNFYSQTTKGGNKRKTNVKNSIICFPSDNVGALQKKNVKFCSLLSGWSVLADWSAANECFILYLYFADYCLAKILLEIQAKIIDVMVFANCKQQKVAVIWIFHIILSFLVHFRHF
jgi:hypothetical protein